ncbi:DUF1624 domain-containing protein [Anoxybacterium hadale]|uniref:DUF1624 domain-containing protein n=1 Tax=Anoxybacterium hadale TaxID=3408580 RepID=A0ACD1A654_9FIRM|nr:DUF1624 domain-containing protein [Clostridiales bacterium]
MEERINGGRQKELDYAKGLAILFMIAVHCLETFANSSVAEEAAYGIMVEFLGSFTSATVFMILLGVGIIYSRKSEPRLLVMRGLLLVGAGYLLNLMRGFLPMLVSWQLTGDDEWLSDMMVELFRIDILQFAGLTFLFFGLTKKMKFKSAAYVAVLSAFALVNFFLVNYGFYYSNIMNYHNSKFFLAALSGLLWGTSELSSFPFLTWIFYPVAGYLFGHYLIKQDVEGKKRLFTVTVLVSTVAFSAIVLLCWYFEIDYGWETDASFYHHLLLGNIVFGSCAFLLIGIVFFLNRSIPELLQTILSRWSVNVTEIYFIQWILIGWIAIGTDYNQFGIIKTVTVTIVVMIASDWIAALYRKTKLHSRKLERV